MNVYRVSSNGGTDHILAANSIQDCMLLLQEEHISYDYDSLFRCYDLSTTATVRSVLY